MENVNCFNNDVMSRFFLLVSRMWQNVPSVISQKQGTKTPPRFVSMLSVTRINMHVYVQVCTYAFV